MRRSEELPEPEIEAAEERPAAHQHDPMDDDALLAHLESRHGLETPKNLSRSTLDGVHDRLHRESYAADH